MLVLLSSALVLVAIALLVIGLVGDDGLLLVGLSIGASLAAAAVLVVAVRGDRSRPEVGQGAPPAAEPARPRP